MLVRRDQWRQDRSPQRDPLLVLHVVRVHEAVEHRHTERFGVRGGEAHVGGDEGRQRRGQLVRRLDEDGEELLEELPQRRVLAHLPGYGQGSG